MNAKSVTKSVFVKIGLLIIVSVVMQACGGGALAAATPTPSPNPTSTPPPTNTSTPKPTSTPRPTNTVLPTPTPASLGEPVKSGSIEISVLDVYKHDNLIPGNGYRYWANPGYMIIDLVVKVQNTGSTPASITWNDTYVIDDTNSHHEMLFAGSRSAAKKEKVDPLSIDYNDVGGSAVIEIIDTVYMRIIYLISDKPEQMVLFGIKDSPLIGFTVKK